MANMIAKIDRAITEEQQERLLAVDRYKPSEGFDFATKQAKPTAHRTSSTYFDVENKFIDITEHLLALLKEEYGHEYRLSQCEPLQLQKYEPNQFFKPHWDFFNVPGYEDTVENDRIATAIIYVKVAEEGGRTNFPRIQKEIMCEPRDVVYFTYADLETKEDTMHEGTPIIKGEKLIATLWIRREDYNG